MNVQSVALHQQIIRIFGVLIVLLAVILTMKAAAAQFVKTFTEVQGSTGSGN
jgi:hypothetical protein